MELVKYIRDLLYHHDCVVVPGFGGFVANERSARIDQAAGNFHPPSREIGFNIRLDHNDGLLISYLSARLSVNYVDARKLVESFTDSVLKKLEAGRPVQFEGIGQFSVDRQQNLQFDPEPHANFLTDAYGLSFFRFPSLDSGEASRRKPGKLHGTASAGLPRRTKQLLRYAAVGIPLIAALTWGAMNTGVIREFDFDISSLNPFSAVIDTGVKHAPLYEEPHVRSDSPVAGKLNEMSSQRRALMYREDSLADRETAVAERVPGAGDILAENTDGFSPREGSDALAVAAMQHHLVAGSFRRQQNALVLMDRLSQEGYNSRLMESEKGMYRVSLFSTDNRTEALRKLYQVREESGRSDVWLLSRAD